MNKNYVKQFRLDNGIKLNGEIKLLNHKYSNHIWKVDDVDIISLGDKCGNLGILTHTVDSDVMAGLLNGTIEFEVPKEYAKSFFIKIKDKNNYDKILELIKSADWSKLYPMTTTPNLLQWHVYKYISDNINGRENNGY